MKRTIRACFLLLALAAVVMAGVSAWRWRQAAQEAEALSQTAFTLAMRQPYSFISAVLESHPEATEFVVPQQEKITRLVNASEAVRVPVGGEAFVGVAEGVHPVSSGARSLHQYSAGLDADWSYAVLTVTCTSIRQYTDSPDSCWEAQVRVEAVNAIADMYTVPAQITVCCGGAEASDPQAFLVSGETLPDCLIPNSVQCLQKPLVVGESYVLCGQYRDNAVFRYWNDRGSNHYYPQVAASQQVNTKPLLLLRKWPWYLEGVHYISSPDDTAWLARAVEIARYSNARLALYCVNDLRCVEHFATGAARVTQGRTFTAEEMAQGAAVCIVSQELAAANGLTVGDSITLQLIQGEYTAAMNGVNDYYHLTTNYAQVEMDAMQTVTLQIIGVYSAPVPDYKAEDFSFNAIFAPCGVAEASGSISQQLPLCLMNPILADGQGEAFIQHLKDSELPEELYEVRQIGDVAAKEAAVARAQEARQHGAAAVMMAGICLMAARVTGRRHRGERQ